MLPNSSTLILAIIIIGCSPSRRIQWHINRLEKLEARHPELFDRAVIDTVVKQRALSVKSNIELLIDSATLERLRKDSAYYKHKADSSEAELIRMGIKDCDTVIKYIKGSTNTETKIK